MKCERPIGGRPIVYLFTAICDIVGVELLQAQSNYTPCAFTNYAVRRSNCREPVKNYFSNVNCLNCLALVPIYALVWLFLPGSISAQIADDFDPGGQF